MLKSLAMKAAEYFAMALGAGFGWSLGLAIWKAIAR